MKKCFVIAIALLCFVSLVVGAHAQDEGTVVVTIPFEFLAGPLVLPAGTYTMSRTSSDTRSPLTISGSDHSSLLLPAAFDDTPVDHARLSFEHVGDTYQLSEVQTQIGTYTIAKGPATAGLAKLARMRPHDSTKRSMTTSSGSQ